VPYTITILKSRRTCDISKRNLSGDTQAVVVHTNARRLRKFHRLQLISQRMQGQLLLSGSVSRLPETYSSAQK
jgi:hypothetical protein